MNNPLSAPGLSSFEVNGELEQDDPGGYEGATNGKEGQPRASSPRHLSMGALADGCLFWTCSGVGEGWG